MWGKICEERKEGIFLFNYAHNTFYLWLYGVTHMVKDHSDSERGNPLPPHRLLFPISSKGSFICRLDNTYHSLCYTSRGELTGTRNSSMGPPWRIAPMTHCTMSELSYHGATSRSPWERKKLCQPTTRVTWMLIYSPQGTLLSGQNMGLPFIIAIFRASQCSTTGVTKVLVCAILSVGWCI